MPKNTAILYKSSLDQLRALCHKGERWLIVVMADPDAIGSALALRRLIRSRVEKVDFARINEVKRPDNLSMMAYLRIKMPLLTKDMLKNYNRFAVVDSQPSHHAEFEGIPFSVVIDHHPATKITNSPEDALIDVRPKNGSCCTVLMGYLKAAGIRPGKMLATALLYGIRVDTAYFTNKTTVADMCAFSHLARLADQEKLARISQSEFFLSWVKPFSNALKSIQSVNSGKFIFFEDVPNADLLVLTVDFLIRINEVRWAAVAGIENDYLVVTLRSDGIINAGDLAKIAFKEFGTAGGHKSMARAEIPLNKVPSPNLERFVYSRLCQSTKRKKDKPCDKLKKSS